jgi:hypothetical protein
MSAPENRLVDDRDIELLERYASTVLNQHQLFSLVTLQIARGLLALIQDRAARQELETIRHQEGAI